VLAAVTVFGQQNEKADLQKERDRISKEIALTNKLLEDTRSNRNKMEGELSLINKKINLREDLIASMRSEVAMYNRKISGNKKKISELEKEIKTLKENYAKAIRLAQRTNRTEDQLMYIFASEDFYQAIRRVRMLQQYAKFRQQQVEQIKKSQDQLQELNQNLLDIIKEKDELINEEQETKKELSSDLNEQEKAVSSLKQEEKSLNKKLKQQEKERNKLNQEIQRIIEAEIRASKKDNAGVYSLTPEAAALSANFESNKGKLPWPVERGVITSRFGNNPHPVLAGITVPNNGISIATNDKAIVRAIFDGTVSAVFSIPGAGQNVIINHGGYRSVYTNLQEVFVSKGQKIESKQSIGTVLTDESTGKSEAHLEIWKVDQSGTTKQDPALWIYKQ
jgi:septal ring factor EnvC (AmiA/AmiB activator)